MYWGDQTPSITRAYCSLIYLKGRSRTTRSVKIGNLCAKVQSWNLLSTEANCSTVKLLHSSLIKLINFFYKSSKL
jgi:hypothetical protein